ncbi:MAG: thiamine-monophosphate kinase [Proteobacteria bacterium]|nr:thiamine-monophosphate kinase [Pseudomonadota bacterium]
MNEFELITRYFARQPVARPDVALGIGDDAAVLDVPPGQQLVVSTDMLVAGVHFPENTDAVSIGHKSLAVNLSDLAAMGATPAWYTLNLSLPQADPGWLEGFCQGMFALALKHDAALVGGDTTRGPLTIGIQIMGLVPHGQALKRAGARPGDRIYVTGLLGEAALGLRVTQGQLKLPDEYLANVLTQLNRPLPRVPAGLGLRGLASACIDISDGLAADLGHILAASNVGARIHLKRLPLSPAYDAAFAQVGWQAALAGGDDYELCFTIPAAQETAFRIASAQFGVACSYIGDIEAEAGLRIVDEQGGLYRSGQAGFDHFRTDRGEAW